jgi:cytochrome oxidase assembly protein ShyY1
VSSTLAPMTKLGRPLHISRLAWYGGSMLAMLVILVMLGLGNWQYSRAKPHVDLAVLAASRAEAAVPLADVLGGATELDPGMVGRRVIVDGRYVIGKQWLVPTADTAGAPGFMVIDVFAPDRSGGDLPTSILVARGWVSTTSGAGSAPAGDVRLKAWIGAPDAVSPTLTSAMPPGQLPEIAPARIAAELPPPVLDGYLGVLTSTPVTSIAAPPEPMVAVHGSWSIINLGYAIQWILFAGAALVAWLMQLYRARQLPEWDAGDGDDSNDLGSGDPLDRAAAPGSL